MPADWSKLVKFWRGTPVPHLDSVPELGSYAYTPLRARELARRALAVASAAPMNSVKQVFDFLASCKYKSDRELFGQEEYWQLPDEFERLRAGDCEDHALWAWRKLVDLAEPVRFTVGLHKHTGHAWVSLIRDGEALLLETTSKLHLDFVPVQRAPEYEPIYSIDREAQFWRHP